MFDEQRDGEGRGRGTDTGHLLLVDRVRAAVDELAGTDVAVLDALAAREELAALERVRR